jgi:hypothetical protein
VQNIQTAFKFFNNIAFSGILGRQCCSGFHAAELKKGQIFTSSPCLQSGTRKAIPLTFQGLALDGQNGFRIIGRALWTDFAHFREMLGSFHK